MLERFELGRGRGWVLAAASCGWPQKRVYVQFAHNSIVQFTKRLVRLHKCKGLFGVFVVLKCFLHFVQLGASSKFSHQ